MPILNDFHQFAVNRETLNPAVLPVSHTHSLFVVGQRDAVSNVELERLGICAHLRKYVN